MTISRIMQGIGESIFSIPFGIVRDKFEPEKLAVPQGIFVSMFSVGCSSRSSHTPAPFKGDKFSHRGFLYSAPVAITIVRAGIRAPFSTSATYGLRSQTSRVPLAMSTAAPNFWHIQI
jgi:hypothetical protein